MPRPPSKKADIEQAAMELFASQGYAATTIKDIAFKSNVTEGALYRHYVSKEQLANTLFERELGNMVLKLLGALDTGEKPAEKLKAVIKALYTAYKETPWPILFVLLNFQNLKGDRIIYQQKNFYDLIIQYANQLIGSTKSKHKKELLPTVLNGIVVQPIFYHYHQRLPRHPLEYLDEVTLYCCKLMDLEL